MDIINIPVIYAINDSYAPMAASSIRSLIHCADPEKHYEIYILHMGLANLHKERLQSMQINNVSISFFDASELIQEDEWPFSNRFGLEIYLRLYASLIYPHYPKLIYLDADTIVLKDIANLYDMDIKGASLGACWSYGTPFMDAYVRHTVNLLPEEYFNSGVLIIDPAEFEANKIRIRCQDILKAQTQIICFDQDALNLALEGEYYHIPDQWNVQWTNHLHPTRDWSERPSPSQIRRIKDAEERPCILHYSSDFKPWNYPEAWRASDFWEAAIDTPYGPEFSALLERRKENPLPFFHISPPWQSFRRNLNLAGLSYTLKELFSNLLKLDGEVP